VRCTNIGGVFSTGKETIRISNHKSLLLCGKGAGEELLPFSHRDLTTCPSALP